MGILKIPGNLINNPTVSTFQKFQYGGFIISQRGFWTP